MRIVNGYHLEIKPTAHLSKEHYSYLIWKLGVLAVSTKGFYDNPVLAGDNILEAYYSRKEYVQETEQQIKSYLQEIGINGKINVAVQATEWTIYWDV